MVTFVALHILMPASEKCMNKVWAVLLLTAAMAGCKTADSRKTPDEPVLIKLGTTQVPTQEFLYVYKKNNASPDADQPGQGLREYLELYTNFKLKVLDAERLGLDTTEAFRRELEGYREQLAQPYLTEKSVTEQLIREAYARLQEEINASHILITVDPDADPRDTLAAYQKAVSLRQQALGGRDFGKLAVDNSQDPSAAGNEGNLGWFTALQMVYPFEDAAYRTPVGQVSPPVRTRFGYHLIKVLQRRSAQGKVRVSHLMVRANPGMPAEDSLAAKRKIDEIYRRLEAGEPWDRLVLQFSEDNASRNRGGQLPAFGTGNMIPTFEEAAFGLKAAGDVSPPVQTPYGWHIIRLEERYPLETFEQLESTISAKVNKDSRSELNQAALIRRLKQEDHFEEKRNNVAAALAAVDTTLLRGNWRYDAGDGKLSDVLFVINDDSVLTRRDFYAHLAETQRPLTNQSVSFVAQRAYEEYVDQTLLSYEADHLAEKYVDYRMLVQEYRDGILLFQLMDDKVWSRALEDTAGLRAYFNTHRDRYRWQERADVAIYSAATSAARTQVKQLLAGKIFPVTEPAFPPVDFGRNQIDVDNADRQQRLDMVADRMRRDTTLYLDIIGHRDAAERNDVSRLRAASVKSFLTQLGVAPVRLIAKDFNARRPVSAAGTPAGNRLVSFQVYGSSSRALERTVNAEQPLTLEVIEGLFEKDEQPVLADVAWRAGSYELAHNGRYYLVNVARVEPARAKTLDEARGVVISDYQAYLEQQWIAQLRAETPVEINEAEVEKLLQN